MRFPSLLAAAAAALTSTIGIAAEAPQRSFSRDGHTYVYTAKRTGEGHVLLVGREVANNERFRLLVKGDRVSGHSGGRPVRFRAERPLEAGTVLAAAN